MPTDADFLPFSSPAIDQQDIDAVVDVLRSGWITTGPKAAELEARFCEKMQCEHAIALSSATAGMHLYLHTLDLQPGDEVITPSMTWVSTVNLIVNCGATPVFVDVDKETLMTTAELIAPLITAKTRCIIPVHFAGAALNLEPLRALASKHAIPLVEDAAHAVGTSYQGQPVGARGTAIFSFHPIKNMTTGEGGMLCTDDAELAQRIRQLKFHGLGVDAFDRQTKGRLPQAEVLEPGFKYNLPDMNAALGIVQLGKLDVLNKKREQLALRYLEQLQAIDEIQPLSLPDYPSEHAWHLFIVRLDITRLNMTRDAFMAALKQQGIGTGLHFRAVHLQHYYQQHPLPSMQALPATEWNSERILSLPLFPDMQPEGVDRVVNNIKAILSGRVE